MKQYAEVNACMHNIPWYIALDSILISRVSDEHLYLELVLNLMIVGRSSYLVYPPENRQ